MRFAITSLLLSTALTGQVLYTDPARLYQDVAQMELALAFGGNPNQLCIYVVCFDSTLAGAVSFRTTATWSGCPLVPAGALAPVNAYVQSQSPPLRAGCVFYVWDPQTGTDMVIPYLHYTMPWCCLVPYGPTTNLGRLDAVGSTAPGGTFSLTASQAQTPNAAAFAFFAPQPAAIALPEGQVLIDVAAAAGPLWFPGLVGGSATLPIVVPQSPGLVGLDLYLQGLLFDAGSSEPIRLTNGLILTIQ